MRSRHAHDWQTGLVPVYQKMHFSPDPIVGGVPTIFTIHNLAFQGVYPASMLPGLGFGPEVLDVQALEYWGQISYLKGGINFSERLTTVSPTYAREILTPEFGFGFDGILRRRADALSGILNGIDVERWNPQADELVGASYTRTDLSGKREAKRVLLETAGLPFDDAALNRPVVGLISRLTYQKGYDLIAAAIDELMLLDVSWVMIDVTRAPRLIHRAPVPLGPLNLCAESDSKSTPNARTSTGIFPTDWTASVWNSAPRSCAIRASSATG